MSRPRASTLLDCQNCREFLARYLEQAQALNPRFSLRAFSRQIALAPSTLSLVLSGKRRASARLLERVAQRITLTSRERDHFRILVRLETVSHAQDRKSLIEQMERNRLKLHTLEVAEADLPALMSWDVFKLNEILAAEADWTERSRLAERAAIPIARAETIFRLLESRELVERDPEGRMRRRPRLMLGASTGANESLRRLHREGLARAQDAVDELAPECRYSSTEMFSLTAEDFAAARRLTEAYLDRLQLLAQRKTGGARGVWAISLHLFRAEGAPS